MKVYFASLIYVYLFFGIPYIVYNFITVHYCLHDTFTHTGYCTASHIQNHKCANDPSGANTFAKHQSHCLQRSLRNKHPKGVAVTKHAPLLTCHYFTAKCLLAKYTRAFSQSATVCTGIGATVPVSVQFKKEWELGGEWQ